MTNSYRFWRLQIFTDKRGSLCPIELSVRPSRSEVESRFAGQQLLSTRFARASAKQIMRHSGALCPKGATILPFQPKRAYFLFANKEKRGGHAHKKEKEVFICIKGSFRAKIHTGKRFKTFLMNKPGQALYTAHLVWHEFDNFTRDAVLLALSSTPYHGQKGYIMDFDEFKRLAALQKKRADRRH